jgi:signal transduction histidine kinase
MLGREAAGYRSIMGSPGDPDRRRRLRRWDVVAAAALTVATQLELWLDWQGYHLQGAQLLSAAATLALMTGAVAFRRLAPLWVLVVVVAAFDLQGIVFASSQTTGALVALVVAFYSVGAELPRWPAALGLVLGLAGVAWEDPGDWEFILIVLGGTWVLGRVVRAHRLLAADLDRKNQELEAERARTAQLAASEERTRIAREVHDVLAHTVSVMVVQAEAAEELLATDVTRSRASLVSIQDTGRDALRELRRLLGVLRDGTPSLERAPQPGLHRLDDLVAQVRHAGLPVTLACEGERHRLSPGIDLCAYRIVQEALTNTLKHARATSASVVLHYGEHSLDVHITDNGVGATPTTGGHGLIGITERVAMYGGRLECGNGEFGGFEVHARLPYDGTVA